MRIESMIKELQKREMLTSFLLLIASHRPLAFLAAQFFYLVDPVASLIGHDQCSGWAKILGSNEEVTEDSEPSCHPAIPSSYRAYQR